MKIEEPMPELLTAYWPVILIAFLIGIAVAWLVFVGNRRTRVERERGDVLDEGAAPARRNQALIDTPASAAAAEASKLSQAANSQEVAHASAAADAEAGPAIAPSPVPADTSAAPTSGGDDLTRIKGLGPKIAVMLGEMGVTSYAQIATWDEADIARIDAQLGRFQGRIERDQWVEQARLLSGDQNEEFAGKFGNNT